MAITQEMIVVLIYILVGLNIKSVQVELECADGGKRLIYTDLEEATLAAENWV